jgi:cellulose synthase/poly-beta-1,6-N-acetylglucosamine synthase-like glycosyltransferase
MTSALPSVSVLLPALNERAFVRDCLDSLAAQDYPNLVEILILDGGSTDGTPVIAAQFQPLARVVDNPRVTAAAAMNVGIDAASGDIICRADAHTIYAKDYVRRCVSVLQETEAANVGGRMHAVGATSFGRAVAAVTSSPFGVGPGRFHYATDRVDVETVYLGCWWRSTLEKAGGYDETSLQWAAEDQELNFRLRQAGGRIVLDPSIRSWYFPRDTPKALWRQYFNYGVAKASTLVKHRTLPYWRPIAPAALVAASALALVAGRSHPRRALGIPVAHASALAVVAARLSRQPGVDPLRSFAALEICHWSYGLGAWSGLLRAVRGKGFDSRPQGHR